MKLNRQLMAHVLHEQRNQRRAKRPIIYGFVVRWVFGSVLREQLRSGKGRGHDSHVELRVGNVARRIEKLGAAKVCDDTMTFRIHQNVCGFEVMVYNS